MYLHSEDRERLARLTNSTGTTKSAVLRQALAALENQLGDPASHPALRIIGLADGATTASGYDLAIEHDRALADDELAFWSSLAPRRRRPRRRRRDPDGSTTPAAGELFVDTSAWFALADRASPHHHAVVAALQDALSDHRRLVTTNLVVAETHALLMRRISQAAALRFLEEVVMPPIDVVLSTPELEEAAVTDWLRQFRDHPFSFADAVSFALMRDRKINEALTLDHHFQIAGFAMLPRGN